MKTLKPSAPRATHDPLTELIIRSLRRARISAVKIARIHKVPIVYQSRGKIVSRRPQ